MARRVSERLRRLERNVSTIPAVQAGAGLCTLDRWLKWWEACRAADEAGEPQPPLFDDPTPEQADLMRTIAQREADAAEALALADEMYP